jgi:molybdopterin/thiamine biosynthesis adenylyltransferase
MAQSPFGGYIGAVTHSARYMRQTALPELGVEGQARLAAGRVLVVGAGGLGSPALLYLAATGVGHIGIAEFDTVSESNLQRQVLYETADIGQPKVARAAARLMALNPHIAVAQHAQGVTQANVAILAAGHDVVVECTDSAAAKAAVCEGARRAGRPVVHAAIDGFRAQVAVFAPGGACYRCLYPVAPSPARSGAVLGPAAGLAGTVQAAQAIALLAPHPGLEPLIGRLWEVDMRTMATRVLGIPRDVACPACGKATGAADLA